MTKRLLIIATAVMTTLLALLALWQFRIVVVFVLISLALAATLRPISRGETRSSFGTRLLLSFQYVVALFVVIMLIFIIGKFLVEDFQQLTEVLALQNTWVVPAWLKGGWFEQTLIQWLPTPDKLFLAFLGQRQLVLDAVLGITQGLGGFISAFLVIFFLSVYWGINQNHFERLWLSLLPSQHRRHARYIWRTVDYEIGAYTRSEIIQSVLAVILLGVGYWLLGSPYPTLLAVTGAIAWLVPVIGAILAIVLPFMLGLLTSTQLSMGTVFYTLLVLIALQVWVEPRLFKLKWDNPVLTFVILLAMEDAVGLVGIIIAPYVLAIFHILWRMLLSERLASGTATRILDLREQHERLQAVIDREMQGPPPPLVVSSMERLKELIDKAEPILDGAGVNQAETPDVFHAS
jgi:predicted PurR-regulated permease PerM